MAMQLHPFGFGIVHAGLNLHIQLHQAGDLHAEFVHHEFVPSHITLHPQHGSQLQLVLQLVAGLVGCSQLVLIALEHDFQRHAIGFVTDIKGQDDKTSFGFMLHKGLQATILIQGFDDLALNNHLVFIFNYGINLAHLPFNSPSPQKTCVLLLAI